MVVLVNTFTKFLASPKLGQYLWLCNVWKVQWTSRAKKPYKDVWTPSWDFIWKTAIAKSDLERESKHMQTWHCISNTSVATCWKRPSRIEAPKLYASSIYLGHSRNVAWHSPIETSTVLVAFITPVTANPIAVLLLWKFHWMVSLRNNTFTFLGMLKSSCIWSPPIDFGKLGQGNPQGGNQQLPTSLHADKLMSILI